MIVAEGAGADTGGGVLIGRVNRQLVRAQDGGKVRIGAHQLEHHLVLAVRLDTFDGVQGRFDRRRRLIAHLQLIGVHHVSGVERLAIVELDALAQGEGPLAGSVGRLPALGELGDRGEALVDVHQGVRHRTMPGDHVRGAAQRVTRVESVGSVAAEASVDELAAAFRRSRHRIGAREHGGNRGRRTHCDHSCHEFSSTQFALGEQPVEIGGLFFLPSPLDANLNWFNDPAAILYQPPRLYLHLSTLPRGAVNRVDGGLEP